jgi:SpoVK/Ycf46/Vps4 family AAA+-type ATPase
MSRPFLTEIDELIRARYAMLYVVTWEEHRARKLIGSVAEKQHKPVYEWSINNGLYLINKINSPLSVESNPRQPFEVLQKILQGESEAIYILHDFYRFWDEPEVARQLLDLSRALKNSRKTIIVMGPVLNLPNELEKSFTIVDLPLPDYEAINHLLTNKIMKAARNFTVKLNAQEKDKLIKAAIGLTYDEAENAFARAIVDDGVLCGKDVSVVLEEKVQIIRKSGVLEYCPVDNTISSVGGMDILKQWLDKRERAFSQEARSYGLPQPRGILLMGVQGCGKSLVAKTIAASWNLPLLRLDMSRIFQEYIGSSEQNMRKAMNIAESIAPVVLWIDEIEKAFSGMSGNSGDGGTTSRVLGSFLTWVQEKTSAVFIVATANQVKGLPPELLRKGRLDEIFFVDLPSFEERKEILAIHLRKKKRIPSGFDIDTLAQVSAGYSGAELEQAVISALHDSFFENREITSDDIAHNIDVTVPLSETMREQIDAMRHWSKDRARGVSSTPYEALEG